MYLWVWLCIYTTQDICACLYVRVYFRLSWPSPVTALGVGILFWDLAEKEGKSSGIMTFRNDHTLGWTKSPVLGHHSHYIINVGSKSMGGSASWRMETDEKTKGNLKSPISQKAPSRKDQLGSWLIFIDRNLPSQLCLMLRQAKTSASITRKRLNYEWRLINVCSGLDRMTRHLRALDWQVKSLKRDNSTDRESERDRETSYWMLASSYVNVNIRSLKTPAFMSSWSTTQGPTWPLSLSWSIAARALFSNEDGTLGNTQCSLERNKAQRSQRWG